MASAQTSPIGGLRARGGAIDPSGATIALLLLGAAIFLLIGCLQSTTFARLTVEGVAIGSVYGSLALAQAIRRAARCVLARCIVIFGGLGHGLRFAWRDRQRQGRPSMASLRMAAHEVGIGPIFCPLPTLT